MKVDGYNIPDNLYYNQDHEWVLIGKDGLVRIGITDYAQKMLREITFVYLPKEAMATKSSDVFGSVESIKAVSELYSPFTGEITEVNEKVRERPRIINEDPYSKGWIIIIRPSKLKEELGKLIKPAQYAAYIRELITIDKNVLIYKWREKPP